MPRRGARCGARSRMRAALRVDVVGQRHARCSGPKLCGSNSPSVKRAAHRVRIADDDRQVVARELAQLLAAAAARRRQLRPDADHRGGDDARAARRHQRRQRAGFGAQALRIGRVLDVAAGVHAPLFVEQRGADLKARVRGVGTLAHLPRGCQQGLEVDRGHQRSFT